MDAFFKCRECDKKFSQPLEQGLLHFNSSWGLFVNRCPYCGYNYMDGQNLDECLLRCEKLDKQYKI